MEELKLFIKPELMILVPMLYIIGQTIKKTKVMHSSKIPFVLGIVGIVLATIYNIATTDLASYKSLLMAIFVGITQGITCAGMSVYANQLIVVQPKDSKKCSTNTKNKNKSKSTTKGSTNEVSDDDKKA